MAVVLSQHFNTMLKCTSTSCRAGLMPVPPLTANCLQALPKPFVNKASARIWEIIENHILLWNLRVCVFTRYSF